MAKNRIGIIILAGGESRKLGTPKQLVEFKGTSLIRHAVEVALRSYCENVIVVLGSRADEIRKELAGLPVETVINENWSDGISTSLKKGLKSLDGNTAAAVIMLSDQPFVTEKTIHSLIETYTKSSKPIIASAYDGILGVPALFDREVFDELLALEGDAGARVVIRKSSSDRVATVAVPEAAFDIDTPSDHERLKEME